jgi:hypothetical protein
MSLLIGTQGIPGLPTEAGASTERRCPGCRSWYRKNEGECPFCGEPPARFNKWLRHAQLDRQLYGQQASAQREADYAKSVGLG